MQYFIGHIGDASINAYYREITADLASRFGIPDLAHRVPAHLTIKYPFASDDVSGLELRIDDFLRDKKAFPLVVKGFDHFDDNTATIFLSVEPSRELSLFTEQCILHFGDLNERKKFDPTKFRAHFSVARHLTPELFHDVWNHISNLPTPVFHSTFSNLTLCVLENEVWKPKRMFEVSL